MWKLGDTVVYGSAGVCRIDDIRDENFGSEIKKYFILKPLFDDKNTFFVPSFNETLMARICNVMTTQEADALIQKLPSIETEWIDNDKQRQEHFRAVLESNDREMVVRVAKSLHERRGQLFEKGKKLRTADEILLRIAETVIENELAHVFGIDRTAARELVETSCLK